MKEIRKPGCSFFVDYEANAAYNTAKTVEKTPYVRNCTTQMRFYSPELNEFFDDFAIDIVKPESITWEVLDDGIRYETKYLCRGSMTADSYEHYVRKVRLGARPLEDGLLELSMSNLVLSCVVMELRKPAEPAPAGILGKLKSRLKK